MVSKSAHPAVLALGTVAVASALSGVLVTFMDDPGPEPAAVRQVAPAVTIVEKPPTPDIDIERLVRVSRHAARTDVRLDKPKVKRLRERAETKAKTAPRKAAERPAPRANVAPGSNRALGYRLMIEFGFGADQWPALDALWTRESNWNHNADNPTSSAYGIPQALTGTHAMPAGYMNDPAVQIRWGLNYIKNRYGTPANAWAHSQRTGWY